MRATVIGRFVLLTGLLLVAACGDDESNSSPSPSGESTVSPSSATVPSITSAPATAVPSSMASPVSSAAISPSTTVVTIEAPPFDPVIDTSFAAVFGKQYADVIEVESFASDVSASLGETTWDTGWQSTPPEPRCTSSESYRTLWWGDLRLTFEIAPDETTILAAWSLGDPSVSPLAPLGPLPPPTERTSGLTTTEGIGIGTSLDDLTAALGQTEHYVSDGRVDIPGALVTTFLLGPDEHVTAIGSGRMECHGI